METFYVVKYSGPFGFIKPWTAVRDGETFSQQFLTPSVIEGMEKKLFPELLGTVGLQGKIVGHRLSYTGLSQQQEVTWSKAWVKKTEYIIEKKLVISKKRADSETPVYKDVKVKLINEQPLTGILNRLVLIEPHLFLAFSSQEHADRAHIQHICLCRNEDVLLPLPEIISVEEANFDVPDSGFNGFELHGQPMYGSLKSIGNPIRRPE